MARNKPSSLGRLTSSYDRELKRKNWKVLGALCLLLIVAVVAYGLVGWIMYQSVSYGTKGQSLFHFTPYILLVTLALSPLAWLVRVQVRDKYKIWALREDARTKHALTLMIRFMHGEHKEGVLKLFGHFDKHPSADLVLLETEQVKKYKDNSKGSS